MKKTALALFVTSTLLMSMISLPAQAATATFPCGTSGSYTVTDGVLTGHSDCVGNLNVDISVLEIADNAFAGNINLAAINILGTVITVGESAFGGARATSLTLGEGIIEIKAGAFAGISYFSNTNFDVSLPNSLLTMGDGAFQQNVIDELVIGDSITNIPRQAFYNNFGGGARSIDFGSSITNIGLGAFFGYQGDTLYFPEGLETIESAAFQDAAVARTVLLPTSISSIASDAFQISPTTILYCGSNTDILNYVFPAPNNAKVCANLVRFDRNGALNNDPEQQVASSSANLTTLSWTRNGISLLGWTSNQNGTGAQYSNGGLFPFTARFTVLYAKWMPSVVFDRNTGLGTMSEQASPVATNLNASQFSKCGFDFAGWSTNQNGGPTTYQDQSSFPFVDDQTRLYAQWISRGENFNPVRRDVTWGRVGGDTQPDPFVNGTVLNMVVHPVSGELYAGGSFTNAAGWQEADYIAKWDGIGWSALGSDGSGNSALSRGVGNGNSGVYDLAFDSFGNLYATGNFTISGIASNVAKWNGTNWGSVGTGREFGDSGRAIAVDSRNNLYVGGHFTDVAGRSAVDYLAKWDGTGWRGVGNSQLNGLVKSIDVGLNDSVYIGTFSANIAGIQAADYIAKWNGSAWSALGGTLAGNGQLQDMPRNITVDSRSGVDVVYVGSLDQEIWDLSGNNQQTGHLIKWDGTRWGQALPDVLISDDHVSDIALAPGGGLIIGGWFDSTDNVFRDECNTLQQSLAYFDGTKTVGLGAIGSSPSFDGRVDSVVFNKDGKLIVGGQFQSAGGSGARQITISNINFAQDLIATPGKNSPSFRDSRLFVSTEGQTLTLNGTNLGGVMAIKVAGKEVRITRKTASEIVIEVPSLTQGQFNVEVISSSEKLTVLEWLQVVTPYVNKRTQVITQFKGYLPTQASVAALKKMYLKDRSVNLLSCFVTMAQNATASQVAKAKAQARATCQSVLEYSRLIRTVDVQVSKTGKAGAAPVLAVTFDRTLSGR